MTRADILRMACEAGLRITHPGMAPEVLSFAAQVAAAEREACALECDAAYYKHIGERFGEVRHGIAVCAAAIRARSMQ